MTVRRMSSLFPDESNPVTNGTNLQNTVNLMAPGDITILTDGKEYRGLIRLPYVSGASGNNPCTLVSAAVNDGTGWAVNFPLPKRVTKALAGQLPMITAGGETPPSTAITVNQNVTIYHQIHMTSSVNPSTNGGSVTFTATVIGTGAGTLTGTVQWSIDGAPSGGPVTLDGSGVTTLTTTLSTGIHTITASYSGAGSYLYPLSNSVRQGVSVSGSFGNPGDTYIADAAIPNKGWTLKGIEFVMRPGLLLPTGVYGTGAYTALVQLGNNGAGGTTDSFDQHFAAMVPADITFDQCLLHSGYPTAAGVEYSEGIACHGDNVKVTRSSLYDIKQAYHGTNANRESHGFWCLNCHGPILLDNSYFSASTECVFFGGAALQDASANVANITAQYCEIEHDLAWNPLEPSWDGSNWGCKNVFELKSGKTVTVNQCTIRNSWAGVDQRGSAMLITPRQAQGETIEVSNVTVTNCHIKNCLCGFDIIASDYNYNPGNLTTNFVLNHDITIQDNLWEGMANMVKNLKADCLWTCSTPVSSSQVGTPVTFTLVPIHQSAGGYDPAMGGVIGITTDFPTVGVGDSLCLEFPGTVDTGGFTTHPESIRVTAVNQTGTNGAYVYGTVTAVPNKTHSGTYKVGARTNGNVNDNGPHWFYIDWGYQHDGGYNGVTNLTINHNTVTCDNTYQNPPNSDRSRGTFFYYGGNGNWQGYAHRTFHFDNNIVPSGDRAMLHPGGDTNDLPVGYYVSGASQTVPTGQLAFNFTSGTSNSGSAPVSTMRRNIVYATRDSGGLTTGALVPVGQAANDTNIYLDNHNPGADPNTANVPGFTNWNNGIGGNYRLLQSSLSPGYKAAVDATGNPDNTDIGNRNWTWFSDGNGPGQLNTTTNLTSSLNPSQSGNSVTLTAQVSGSGVPTGSVQFKVDGANSGSPVTLNSSGIATLTTSSLAVGSHTVQAVYSGDATFLPSTSNTVTQQVNSGTQNTTLLMSASPNPAVQGASVTLSALLNTALATGTVTFKDGGTTLSTVPLSGSVASMSKSDFTVATHSLSAIYNGDANYNGSTGTTSLVVNANVVTTQTTLSASPSPGVSGGTETLTATVSPTAATGTIQFSADGSNIGSPVALSLGTATTSLATLGVGTHTLTAAYSGDANDLPSTGTTSLTINAVTPALSLSASPNPSTLGQSVSLKAITNPTSATGTVTFKADGTQIGSPVTLASGTATTSLATLLTGSHTILATYSGDINNNPATATTSLTVNAASGGGGTSGGAGGNLFTLCNSLAIKNQTITTPPVTNLGGFSSMLVEFKVGGPAALGPAPLLDIYLQTSMDGGITWQDIAHTGMIGNVVPLVRFAQIVGDYGGFESVLPASDGQLQGERVIQGPWGDRVRLKLVCAGADVRGFVVSSYAYCKSQK